MLLIGAELLRIGKNLYMTKSDQAQTMSDNSQKKHKNIGMATHKTPFQ